MDFIIKNLIKEIGYGVNLKNLCIYDFITIISTILGIGFAIAFYLLRDSNFKTPLLVLSVIAIAIAQISTSCLNASHREGLKTQNNIHHRLKTVEEALYSHKMLRIKNHKDIVVFTKKLKDYYHSKFDALSIIKKTVDDITKVLLIPTTLALISYVLKDENEYADMESKLIFVFVFTFFILWIIVMYNMFFELVRSIIKIINIKTWVFMTDLELLSSFEIREFSVIIDGDTVSKLDKSNN